MLKETDPSTTFVLSALDRLRTLLSSSSSSRSPRLICNSAESESVLSSNDFPRETVGDGTPNAAAVAAAKSTDSSSATCLSSSAGFSDLNSASPEARALYDFDPMALAVSVS